MVHQKNIVYCFVFFSIFFITNVFPGFNFSHETSTIRFGDGGSSASFYLSNNITGWNGTLKKGANGTLSNATSKTIAFANGVLDTEGVRSRMTSTYEPGGTYELTLGANQTLVAQPGQITQSINIAGAGAKIEGQPTFSSAIVFEESATAYFGIQSRLNQNIQFAVGEATNALYLTDDLRLADGVTIVNDGTIDVNGKSFSFGGTPLTLDNTIYWGEAGDIKLNSKVTLNGTWDFNDESTLNGNGNVLDLSGGGVLSLAASTTLHLTDVVIKGIGNSTFSFGDIGSTLRLSNVTLHLPESVAFTSGRVYVDGPSTVYIPDTDWAFNGDSMLTVSGVTLWVDDLDRSGIDGITGNLTMAYSGTIKEIYSTGDLDYLSDLAEANSEVILLHEVRLDTAETNISNNDTDIATNVTNIATNVTNISNNDTDIATNVTNISNNDTDIATNVTNIATNVTNISNNDTDIATNVTNIATNVTNISNNDTDIATNVTNIATNATNIATNVVSISNNDDFVRYIHGERDFTLSTNTTLTVDLFLSADHVFTIGANMTLDGANHTIVFPKDASGVLSVGSNALTLENVTLRNFSPGAISLTTGTVTFGDGTNVEMMDNQTLASTNYTMSCSGAVTVNCFGNELDVSGRVHAMDVLAGSTLTINNARIAGLGGVNGSSYANNIRCIGADSTLVLKHSELMLQDNYTFGQGYLDIYQDVAIRGPEMPSGTSLVFAYQSQQPATIKTLGRLMLDRYMTFSYDSNAARKDRIVMEDATSILHLNGCTLYATHTGLELTGGRLLIEDKVTVRNEASNAAEAMVFKDPLDIDVLSGGVLDLVEGLLEYQ